MHPTIKQNGRTTSAGQPNRLIDTGLRDAYLHYAMAVVAGRSRRQLDAVAVKAGATARPLKTVKVGTHSLASATDASGTAQGTGGAGGDGNAEGGDGDGDGPGRRATTALPRRRSSPAPRPSGHPPSSSKFDPNSPHRRGLTTLVLLTLVLVCAALIFGLTGHDLLAAEAMGMAGGLPFLAQRLVRPK